MEDYTFLEFKTVLTPPLANNFIDYINCPRCEIEIDVNVEEINNNTSVYCEGCDHLIKFKIVRI